jgi:O-acetyl-ADP-ribose deacetylase (regulator of RNase III)
LQGSELATGKAIITAGYNLPCRYVIHTVGPIVPNGIPTPEQEWQLAECYRSCLRLAADRGCRTIAFCCISTGEFRFPNRRAAEIAIECVNTTINNPLSQTHNSTIKVVFNVFKDIDYDIYNELLRTY